MISNSANIAKKKPDDERMLVVLLTITKGESPEVRSCEVLGRSYRNRVSFTHCNSHEAVFNPHFYAGIEDSLKSLTGETELVSFPDFIFEMPGITLSGLRLVSTKEEEGKLSVICRFRRILGSMHAIFRNDMGLNNFVTEENARLSSKLLAELAMPLLNICNAFENNVFGGDVAHGDIMKKMSKKADEITFQIELIKRYVSNAESFERMADSKDHYSHNMNEIGRGVPFMVDQDVWVAD